MIHDRLDIDHWKSVFSLARLREAARQQGKRMEMPGDTVTGPYEIAVLEQLRESSYANLPDIERVPTDVFIWSRGEPPHREVTKVGGLPYREAGKPWPMAPSGTPMNFVAQFCFADSCDIVPNALPGDILLFFAEGDEWSPGNYQFKWVVVINPHAACRAAWRPQRRLRPTRNRSRTVSG
jgi:Domain of unknown function (DUF1963)